MAKRRSRGKNSPTMSVAVAWYDDVQWAQLKQVAVDADNLDESYEAWLRNAERLERELRQKGIEIRRVDVKVESLIAWCQSNNKPINGKSRAEFAAETARRQDGS
jgi:hypothetical protein